MKIDVDVPFDFCESCDFFEIDFRIPWSGEEHYGCMNELICKNAIKKMEKHNDQTTKR